MSLHHLASYFEMLVFRIIKAKMILLRGQITLLVFFHFLLEFSVY